MSRRTLLVLSLAATLAPAQIKHTSTPIGDTLTKALARSSLTTPGSAPFHLRLVIAEPENPQSPYTGTVELWWVSPQQWRREITGPENLHQLIIMNNGAKTEQDTGDYFPLWLDSFVVAVLDPVSNVSVWSASGIIDRITLPDDRASNGCTRSKFQIGSGTRATDAFTVLCFDSEGRISSFVTPRYAMEFHDFRPFGHQQFARQYVDYPEPGTKLVGTVTVLEDFKEGREPFTPLGRNDHRFLNTPSVRPRWKCSPLTTRPSSGHPSTPATFVGNSLYTCLLTPPDRFERFGH